MIETLRRLRAEYRKIYDVEFLRPVEIIFETVEGLLFGVQEVTLKAPHLLDHIEIKRYMSMAILALVPSALSAVFFFGLDAIRIIAVSYIAGGIVEVLFAVIRKKDIEEGFLVTGLIFPLTLPPTTPTWMVVVGSVVGVFFGKEVFGGTGRNIFNPALVGRLFMTIAFPQAMSASWQAPFSDAITSATPLSLFKGAREFTPFFNLLFGQSGGSMGELFRLGIIVGGVFLMLTKVANWRIPVTFIGTVLILSVPGSVFLPYNIAAPLPQLFSGGLLFGAMFMVTDPVTSPYTRAGKYVFGISCGVLTVIIRGFSGYTEGVMFSIIFMNALTPLLDHIVIGLKYREGA
ncbi:MAG: RnfABCDGE type electron transport complex subunit D [bacterium]|nr:RnfABCDGE type electron transport complex subunit D [bacterium]